jgi:hypothetical protein
MDTLNPGFAARAFINRINDFNWLIVNGDVSADQGLRDEITFRMAGFDTVKPPPGYLLSQDVRDAIVDPFSKAFDHIGERQYKRSIREGGAKPDDSLLTLRRAALLMFHVVTVADLCRDRTIVEEVNKRCGASPEKPEYAEDKVLAQFCKLLTTSPDLLQRGSQEFSRHAGIDAVPAMVPNFIAWASALPEDNTVLTHVLRTHAARLASSFPMRDRPIQGGGPSCPEIPGKKTSIERGDLPSRFDQLGL